MKAKESGMTRRFLPRAAIKMELPSVAVKQTAGPARRWGESGVGFEDVFEMSTQCFSDCGRPLNLVLFPFLSQADTSILHKLLENEIKTFKI